ncbi:MAG: hypothetical protein NTW31_02490 [Bacteroidetes bacterium]|nr:hypothetical protein [Bacteroidota bacterium]
MKTKMILLIVTVVFVMVNVELRAQEKFNLNYKMGKGKTYRYLQGSIVESTQEMGGQEMKMNTDAHSLLKYEIDSVSADGTMSLVYSFEEVSFHMKGMGRDTTMDMKDKENKPVKAKLTASGKLTKEPSHDTAKTGKSSFSIGNLATVNFTRLPDHKVGIGEKWSRVSTDTTDVGEGQIVYKKNIEYVLTGKEKKGSHDCVKIEYKGSMEIVGKMKQMGMDLAMEGSGDTSGTLWFDAVMGLIIEELDNNTVDMTMALTGQQQMTIPITQKITTTQSLKE